MHCPVWCYELVLIAVLVFCADCFPPLWFIYNILSLCILELEWVYNFCGFHGSREVQSKAHLTSPSPTHHLVAVYSSEKCCRVTGGLVICWVGQSIPRGAEEKGKSQRYLAFFSCALGCGPLKTWRFLLVPWDVNKKELDIKRGTDSTQPCPKPWWYHSTLWDHNTFIWCTDCETHTCMHPYFSR